MPATVLFQVPLIVTAPVNVFTPVAELMFSVPSINAAPATVLWRGLEQAAAERRVGDTVLFVLQMLNGRPETAHPEALVACLRALSRVGLGRDARAIAVATALISHL